MTKHGLALTQEVSLKIDWVKFSTSLVTSISEGFKAFLGDVKAGADATSAISDAFRSVKVDVPKEARALELILLSFAWSFDALRASGHVKEADAQDLAKSAVSMLKARVSKGDMIIPFDFFAKPTEAEPYKLLRDEFVKGYATFRAGSEDDGLSYRFDVAFREAIWQVWRKRGSVFEELAKALDHESASLSDVDRQWRAYCQSLIADFHVVPVFGQEETSVSLAQLYVPLRCFWKEDKAENAPENCYQMNKDDKDVKHHVRDLKTELDAWIAADDPADWLRLVGGGPGSGKSTSAKEFAALLALDEGVTIRPLFIPLQRLDLSLNLRDSINSYFKSISGCPFEVGPLERHHVESGPPLVLIFDGLDEMSRPGSHADEIVRDMMGWITDLHKALCGNTKTLHKVLVTGRMPSFQMACTRSNIKGNAALEVLNFLSIDEMSGDEGLLKRDDRALWWQRYSVALGKTGDIPAGLSDKRLESLSAEPLLCYLLALSGYLEDKSEEAADNRNKIYAKLMHDVWERGYGGGRTGTGESLNNEVDFDRLFETMALAAWHDGDERVASEDRFKAALKITDAQDIYDQFQKEAGSDVNNLAVNFYLKSSERAGKGFEFTHKSFGEYLAARALMRKGMELVDLPKKQMSYALEQWLEGVDDGDLSDELLDFMRGEGRLLSYDLALKAKQMVEQMMGLVIADGFTAHKLTCATYRDVEARQRKAETMLMAFLNVLTLRVAEDDKKAALINIDWAGDRLALGRLIHRMTGVFSNKRTPSKLFSYVNAESLSFMAQALPLINFEYANLKNTFMDYSLLASASLSLSDLEGAHLINATLTGANLTRATLRGATLTGAHLTDADLTGADLRGATLRGANLTGATLRGANLRGATLTDANLTRAIMTNKQRAYLKSQGYL